MKELQKPSLHFSGIGKSPLMAKPTSASSHVDQEEEISKVEPVLINRRNKKIIMEWEEGTEKKEHNSMQPNRNKRIMGSWVFVRVR